MRQVGAPSRTGTARRKNWLWLMLEAGATKDNVEDLHCLRPHTPRVADGRTATETSRVKIEGKEVVEVQHDIARCSTCDGIVGPLPIIDDGVFLFR